MPKANRNNDEPQVFEQTADGRGRIRLDRPLTSEEAAEQDRQNRERHAEERRKRFAGRNVER